MDSREEPSDGGRDANDLPLDVPTEFSAAWPIERWKDVSVLVAVSAGADSVALWTLMHRLRARSGQSGVPLAGRLILAHFNHGLRGSESDEDAQFVARLAEQSGSPVVLGTASAGGPRDEQSLRDERYAFLLEAAEAEGARYLVTAHTADDQVETVLHRIVRGTGVAGLAGIPATRRLSAAVTLRRPLLGFARRDLRRFLQQSGQAWREDATNADSDYTRNQIRNELLPSLRADYNARLDGAILRLAASARDHQRLVDRLVEAFEHLVEPLASTSPADSFEADLPCEAGSGVRVRLAELRDADPLVKRELLRRIWQRKGWPQQAWTRRHWLELVAMAGSSPPASSLDFPGAIRAIRTVDALLLTPLAPDQDRAGGV